MAQPGGSAALQEPDRRKRLETADRVLDESVASVPSGLRASLRSVLRLARLLREFDGAMDAGTREYAEYIRASAEHMAVMLNDLKRPHGAGHPEGGDRPRAGGRRQKVTP